MNMKETFKAMSESLAMNKKGSFSGMGGDFIKNPAAAITTVVLVYVGIQFLSQAIQAGGVIDTLFNALESILNNTGFSGLSSIFNSGGAVYLLLGVGVIAGAIYLVKGGRD